MGDNILRNVNIGGKGTGNRISDRVLRVNVLVGAIANSPAYPIMLNEFYRAGERSWQEEADELLMNKVATLAEVLNLFTPIASGKWQGRGFIYGTSYQETVKWLTNRSVWAAELKEIGKGIGHLVIVDRFDEYGQLCIRDPWDGTSYKIEIEEFINYWTLRGVRWIQEP